MSFLTYCKLVTTPPGSGGGNGVANLGDSAWGRYTVDAANALATRCSIRFNTATRSPPPSTTVKIDVDQFWFKNDEVPTGFTGETFFLNGDLSPSAAGAALIKAVNNSTPGVCSAAEF